MKRRISYLLLAVMTASALATSTACKQSESSTSEDSSNVPVPIEESIEEQESIIDEEESSDDEEELSDYDEESSYVYNQYDYLATGRYDFHYEVINDKIRLLRYNGGDGDFEQNVVIPASFKVQGVEYPTEIGAGCFKGTRIITLVLPDNITEIPDSMCEDCRLLESIKFSNVTSIGAKAFFACKNLSIQFSEINNSDITILKKIGQGAFAMTAIEGKIVIPSGVELGDGAFGYCDRISEVEFQSGITAVPASMFIDCKNIGKVTLPDTLEEIGIMAFNGTNISSLKIPQNTTVIGESFVSTGYYGNTIYAGTIYGYKGTAAEEYANENGIIFSALD